MKISLALDIPSKRLYVNEFGIEDISEKAHWGRGCRDLYIIHYVIEGEGVFNSQRVHESQGFIIKPGQLHRYYSSKSKPWKYFWVSYSGEDAEEIERKYIGQNARGIFDFDFKNELITFADSILGGGEKMSGTKLLGYFYILMAMHGGSHEESRNSYISRAELYIKTNYHKRLAVTDVAKTLNISDRYLYNLFILHKGIAPKKYINQIKLEKAASMLKDTDCSVGEAAFTVGFENPLEFSKFFSKNMGLSPLAYRKESRKAK